MLKKTLAYHTILNNIFNLNKISLFKMPFYAVAKGRASGIFMTWPDCEAQVKGFPGARYKKFDTVVAAQEFIDTVGKNDSNGKVKPDSKSTTNKFNNKPSNSNNNLKRPLSSSSKGSTTTVKVVKQKAKKQASESEHDESFSDDDLNTVLMKQLDDVEKRLKGFEKNVDKIIKKGTSKLNRQTMLIDIPQPKRRKKSGDVDFEVDNDGYVKVYTDGACSGNGRSGAKAGLGVFWGDGHPLNLSKPVSGRATNNCGEIQAATQAIKLALKNGVKKLSINTDSKFLINSVTLWMPGWKRKGWKTKSGDPVKNEEDFKVLDSVQNQLDIKWIYVEAHCGIHGNEMADNLAKAGAANYNIGDNS